MATANPATYMAILDRPLFAPDRKPPPPPDAVAEQPPPDPLANIELFGLFSGEGVGGVLVRVEGKIKRVRLGETVGPWTVSEINGRSVTFVRGDESRVLTLAYLKAPRAAAPDGPVSAGAAAPAGPAPVDRLSIQQQEQEAARERLRQRNELFRKAGLPPVKE
jgi:hypothetical protein